MGDSGLTPRRQSRMVTSMSAETLTIAGVGVALLAVLVPAAGVDPRRRARPTRRNRRHPPRLHALAERVARIEGQLSWRPANGTPVPPAVPSTEPTAT